MADDEIKIDLDALDEAAGHKEAKKKEPAKKDPPKEEALEEAKVTPEAGLEKLQRQLDGERNAREAAERERDQALNGEAKALTDRQANHLTIITTAIDNITGSNTALKKDYAAALAAQDFDAAAELQLQMSTNAAKLIQLEAGKKQIESQPAPKPRVVLDPVEQFTKDMSPQSAAWIRAHPETVRDPKLNRKMIRAHEDALDEGVKPDTPEYFAAIEKAIGAVREPIKVIEDTKLEGDSALSDASAPTKKSPPAAPVTRSGNGAGPRPNIVTLTREQVEAAEASGLTPEEYAKNLASLRKEGRMN
jgi:hypothetical protein